MRGTFGDGIDRLIETVGRGHLKGSVEVDQIYAKYQHEKPELNHPDGGKAYYLRDPLFEKSAEYMQKLADKTITVGGSEIEQGMVEVVEDLSTQVYIHAPLEFADLKASGHPTVESAGAVVYDRAPNVPRLTREELRIKARLRTLFEPGRYR